MFWIDILIVVGFVIYAVSSGFRSKDQASENLDEYFLAGRSIKGWRAGFSMAATQMAADTPLLVTGLVATAGIFALWRLWVYALAFLLMGFVLASSWRRAGILTDAELTEVRYSGRGVLPLRVLKAVYYGTVINCIVLAMVLVAAMRIAEVFLPWHEWIPAVHAIFQSIVATTGLSFGDPVLPVGEVCQAMADPAACWKETITASNLMSILLIMAFTATYSTTGGLRSVIATDVVQFILGMIGTAVYGWVVFDHVGGISGISTKMVELYGHFEGVNAEQMLSFAPTGDEALMGFLIIISLQWFFQMNSDGTGYLAQRSMACETDRQARIAAVVFTWMQVVVRSVIWLVIAVGLLILYPFTEPEMAEAGFQASREILFVTGVNDLLPFGVRGLMLTGLLAALASTIDTHLNWGASYWSNDVYDRLICQEWQDRRPNNTELVLVARLSNLFILIIALVIMANLGSIQEAWKISLIFGAGMGSVLVMRWLWERITLWSELAAMATSIVAAPLIVFGPNIALALNGYTWSTPLEEVSDPALVELATLLSQDWLQLSTMALLSTAAAIGVTFFTPLTDQKVLDAFYERVRPMGFWHNTASRMGQEKLQPIMRLVDGLRLTVLCGLSVFFMLMGLGKFFVHTPGEGFAWAVLWCVCSVALVPLWWKGVFAQDEPDEDEDAPSLRAATLTPDVEPVLRDEEILEKEIEKAAAEIEASDDDSVDTSSEDSEVSEVSDAEEDSDAEDDDMETNGKP